MEWFLIDTVDTIPWARDGTSIIELQNFGRASLKKPTFFPFSSSSLTFGQTEKEKAVILLCRSPGNWVKVYIISCVTEGCG